MTAAAINGPFGSRPLPDDTPPGTRRSACGAAPHPRPAGSPSFRARVHAPPYTVVVVLGGLVWWWWQLRWCWWPSRNQFVGVRD